MLEEVRIPRAAERLKDYPHRFSGGMRQRVMIAIALSCDPKLLIADEPTTALDVTVQASVLDLLDDLRHEHDMAMIIITHDMGVVAEAADDIIVMYAGQIVEHAPTLDLFDHPEHPYTEALLGALPQIEGEGIREGRLTAIPGRPPDLIDPPVACRFGPRCPYAGDDSCTELMPELREFRKGHWVRSAHPASERVRTEVTHERHERSPRGQEPGEALPDPRRAADRAHGRRDRRGRRHQLRDRARGDARPGRRVGLGQVDDRLLRPPAAEANLRLGQVRGHGADRRSAARSCAGCGARCRSSSRTRTPRSTRA